MNKYWHRWFVHQLETCLSGFRQGKTKTTLSLLCSATELRVLIFRRQKLNVLHYLIRGKRGAEQTEADRHLCCCFMDMEGLVGLKESLKCLAISCFGKI